MAPETIHLAGDSDDQPHAIPLDEAAQRLFAYNRVSARLYDYADTDNLAAAQQASPKDRITLTDLGRITCLGASLRYDRAHVLLYRSEGSRGPDERRVFDWADDLPALGDLASLEDAAFLNHPAVEAAWRRFTTLTELGNIGWGTATKLLHLKWPAFYPIVDRDFRTAYRARAVVAHNNSNAIPGRRQRKNANIRAYWLAFRTDLHRNRDALAALPGRVTKLAAGDPDSLAHADRLAQLAPLRLLDMLAWDLGRSRNKP